MRSCGFAIIGVVLAAPALADGPVDYAGQIKPILQARCYPCHGVLKQNAGLRLDTAAFAIEGGDGGAAIVPGDADASPLIERVASRDESERMPPEGEPLTEAQIALLRGWIGQGARHPADERPERDPRAHWAFRTPMRPPVPEAADPSRVRNPIDAFLAAARDRRGLLPQRPAETSVWLRRVSLDLIGLPPTRDELDAFDADDSPEAVAKVADRLLASPHHGERWGRHWMDIWRYSDWWGLGAEVRNSQKHIWHWRDWIIESLNADAGYDQMLRAMIAADELDPDDLDALRASGFLARQYFKFNRTSWLDETVEHTSKAFLGLTFNCAKCHDHKYDPIRQVDYYRLRAVFEPYQIRTELVPGVLDPEQDGIPRAFDCNLDATTYLHIRGDDRRPDKSRVMEPALPAFLAPGGWTVEPVRLPVTASHPGLRPFVLGDHLKAAAQKITDARAALDAARRALAGSERVGPDPALALALVVAETALATAEAQPEALKARAAADRARLVEPRPSDLAATIQTAVWVSRVAASAQADEDAARARLALLKAPADKKAEAETKRAAAETAAEAARQAIDAPGADYTPLAGALKTLESNLETEASRRKPFPETSTGRRSALARWLTDARNPLTARVAVNHVWARHFGRPLVPTVFDFGRKGTPPTHPELLDWLAVELVEHGWSLKHIHRLIVTSDAYRMTSSTASAPPEDLTRDPENRFYWRMNPIRMESEAVRDSLLSLAGALDPTLGGPSIPVHDAASRRRSLYFVHSHNEHQPFLSMFDDASVLECYRRAESVVPQQALALENSPLAFALAGQIARRLGADSPSLSDDDFVRAAFRLVLAAEPTAAERAACRAALARLTDAAPRPDAAARARVNLVHALLNHNDFVTVR